MTAKPKSNIQISVTTLCRANYTVVNPQFGVFLSHFFLLQLSKVLLIQVCFPKYIQTIFRMISKKFPQHYDYDDDCTKKDVSDMCLLGSSQVLLWIF